MNDRVRNLFVRRSVAVRYAAARPYFHPIVAARIVAFTGSPRFGRSLDVACGTGQSARGIAGISDLVEAVDVSPEMIAAAESHERVHYQVAAAEHLPFPDGNFNLITVGLAIHWFDQAAFLREAWRVMDRGAWLVIYNHAFTGEMSDNAKFRSWGCGVYPQKFPAPPRHPVVMNDERLAQQALRLCGTESFTTEELMTAYELKHYLMTQSNVIDAIEGERTSMAEAADWIEAGISPFFMNDRAVMKFSGHVSYVRRATED